MVSPTRMRILASLSLFLLLAVGGRPMSASARDSVGLKPLSPLSTAGESPYFDWGEFKPNAGTGSRSTFKPASQPELPTAPGPQAVLPRPAQVQPQPEAASPKRDPDGSRTAAGAGYVGTPSKVTLHGTIERSAVRPAGDGTLEALFASVSGDDADSAGQSQPRFHNGLQKVAEKGKSVLNFAIDYRAFGPSMEGANVILDGQERSKSLNAGAYYGQRQADEKHLQIVSSIMELGMGLGMRGSARGRKLVEAGFTSLRQLAGDQEANRILSTLKAASGNLSFPADLADQELWSMKQREDKIKLIVQSASSSDPAINDVRKDLFRYSNHSKLARHATAWVQGALGIACFSPTILAPIAETSQFFVTMATGGPEQDKLVKELYLSKRLDSRMKVISEKAHMAVDTYHMALISENPVLLALTESLVRQMSGEEAVGEVFGRAKLALDTANPEAAGGSSGNDGIARQTPATDPDRFESRFAGQNQKMPL